ncbi:MAG: hypothetical protein ACRDKH_05210, partial [Solirubrobacterales bacterium]
MRWRVVAIAAAVCLAWTAAGAVLLWPDRGDRDTADEPAAEAVAGPTRDDAVSLDPAELDPAGIADPAAGAEAADPEAADDAGPPAPDAAEFAVERAEPPYRV